MPAIPAPARYLPMFHLTDVLPLPNASQVTAHRGDVVVGHAVGGSGTPTTLPGKRPANLHRDVRLVAAGAESVAVLANARLRVFAGRVVVTDAAAQREARQCPLILRVETAVRHPVVDGGRARIDLDS